MIALMKINLRHLEEHRKKEESGHFQKKQHKEKQKKGKEKMSKRPPRNEKSQKCSSRILTSQTKSPSQYFEALFGQRLLSLNISEMCAIIW